MKIEKLMSENANILTAYAVAMILIVGTGVVSGQGQWYGPAILISIVFAIFLLIKNAKVALKIGFCALSVLLFASFAFQVGVLLDPSATFALVWMGTHLFLAFLLLAVSYMSFSGRSRWMGVAFSQIVMFTLTYSLSLALVNWVLAVAAGAGAGVVAFVLFFFVFNKVDRKGKKMPARYTDLERVEQFCASLEGEWNTVVEVEGATSRVFVWNDTYAYMLIPLDMDYAFRTKGKRGGLSYDGKDVRPWLLGLLSGVPYGKARGADITVVLLDTKNRNGNKAQAIGVPHPDAHRPLLVGIVPGKSFNKIGPAIMREADSLLGPLKAALSTKQKQALSGFGKVA